MKYKNKKYNIGTTVLQILLYIYIYKSYALLTIQNFNAIIMMFAKGLRNYIMKTQRIMYGLCSLEVIMRRNS
jgi:hypothetical protein